MQDPAAVRCAARPPCNGANCELLVVVQLMPGVCRVPPVAWDPLVHTLLQLDMGFCTGCS